MSAIEYKQIALEGAKLTDNESRTFEGYGSVFGVEDFYKDIIEQGSFEKTLAAHAEAGTMPDMRSNHVSGDAAIMGVPFPSSVGKWIEMREDSRGLYVKGQLLEGHAVADSIYASMKAGLMGGLSIGFFLGEGNYSEREEGDSLSGRIIHNIGDLVEVSVVDRPANPQAQVNLESVKGSLPPLRSLRDCEYILRNQGFSREMAKRFVAKIRDIMLRDGAVPQRDVVCDTKRGVKDAPQLQRDAAAFTNRDRLEVALHKFKISK